MNTVRVMTQVFNVTVKSPTEFAVTVVETVAYQVSIKAGIISDLDSTDFRSLLQGSFKESFDALVTSDGATIDLSLEKSGTGNLTMQFSDGLSTLDCTPALSIELIAGSGTIPQPNYLYILQSTKTLTKSTSAWPSAEHIKVAYVLVLTAAYTQASGALINQNWNDHLAGNNMGHLLHIAEHLRATGAVYHSGCAGAGADDYTTSAAGTVFIKIGTGEVFQLHKHDYVAKDTDPGGGGDTAHVINHDTTPYVKISNLYDVLNDASGGTLANKYFNVVLWGVANKGGEYSPVMVNLPTGTYNRLDDAEGDSDGHDVFTIPPQFATESSTGFLIARLTFRKEAGSWTYHSTVNLRGHTPQAASGGSAGGALDGSAIHDNVAGEIGAITEKAVGVAADVVLIEDSVASGAKKRTPLSGLPYPVDSVFSRTGAVVAAAGDYDEVKGGTGQTTFAQGDTLYADAVNSLAKLAKGTALQNLRMNAGATAPEWHTEEQPWTLTIIDPVADMDLVLPYVKNAITIVEIRGVVRGASTPNQSVRFFYGSDVTGAGTAITPLTGVTNTTTGQTFTLSVADIPAGNYIWMDTSAPSGTVDQVSLTITWKRNG